MDEKLVWGLIGLLIGVLLAGAAMHKPQVPRLDKETKQFLDAMCRAQGFDEFAKFVKGYGKDVKGRITSYQFSISCVKIRNGVRTERTIGTIEVPAKYPPVQIQ